jgi:hypothetical protein
VADQSIADKGCSHPAIAIFLLCLGGFAHQTLSVAVISTSADLFPRRELATVTGLAALIAGLNNLAFTLVIGRARKPPRVHAGNIS